MASEKTRCEGWRRYGGIFTFGRPEWVQCKEDAEVVLKITQDDETEPLPACKTCWQEAIENKVNILEAKPITT